MGMRLSYLFKVPPSYRCDGCGTMHSAENAALACCDSAVTGCGVTEVNDQELIEDDIDAIPCWYLEEAGQLRLF